MNSFMGIEIGRRSVLTHQTALEITGHNIANANTPGYTRQSPEIVTTKPWYTPSMVGNNSVGQLGTGVDIDQIKRLRDEFVDLQIRNESKTAGYWSGIQDSMSKIEVIINEPSDDGIRSVMDAYWESWQDLSGNPESEASRSVVAQRALAMGEAFNHTYKQLSELREDLNASVKIKVDEINSMSRQIADLNNQILSVTIAGKQPNDLIDKRDLLLDDLSKIADVKVNNDKNGMIAIQLGDRMLVQGIDRNELTTIADTNGMYMVAWQDTGSKAQISSGELRGLLDARGKTELAEDENSNYKEIIPQLIDKLNTMAKTIMVKTNELHRSGYSLNNKTGYPDGTDFFQMPDDPDRFENWAEYMQVNTEIQDNPKNIAAASNRTWDASGNKSNFGDGSNALAIARLKQNLNQLQYDLKTEGVSIDLASSTPLQYLIDTGSGIKTIQIAAPNSYKDMDTLANAIQAELDEMELPVKVSADGNQLRFYSTSASNLEVILPGTGIKDLAASGLQDGQYRIDTAVSQPGAADASLTELQHYNQGTADSIFGSGQMGTVTDAATLGVNASIELTVTGVDKTTGEVTYSYKSHEYGRDGAYTSQTGSFTLTYGGADPQNISIGSLNLDITGLDTKSISDVTELKAGDKGILNLTAATEAATTYQRLDLSYEYGEPDEITQGFVFNDGALNGLTDKELHFFTLNDNRISTGSSGSSVYGTTYDSSLKLSTDTITGSSPAAFFSSYENGDATGMVESVTIDDYWRSITADVGVQSQEAERMVDNQEVLLNQLETKKQSLSGVSLDEEMTNMLKFQHAYNAAARFITSIDEQIETIISRMGLVGR